MKKITYILFSCILLVICNDIHAQDSFNSSFTNLIGNASGVTQKSGTNGIKAISIEVGHGQAFVDWTNSWLWQFSNNYLIHFNQKLAAGAGVGVQFEYGGLHPWLSLNSIFGDKVNNFAGSFDVNFVFSDSVDSGEFIWPTIGLYYKNFFLKYMPTFIMGYDGEHYIQLGYSYYMEL